MVEMDEENDHKYHGGRGKLLQEIGWENCFKLGELLQGCWSQAKVSVIDCFGVEGAKIM